MNRRPQKVNDLVLRNFVTSISICFLITVFMAVMFQFSLEDEIFGNQVSVKADQLSSSVQYEKGTNRIVSGLEMEYFHGTEAMPKWLAGQIKSDWVAGEYEVFGGEHGHYHLAVRGEGETKQYLIFNARTYVRSTEQVWGFVILIALLGGLMLFVTVFFLLRMTKKLSLPIEKIASAVTSGKMLEHASLELSGAPVEIKVLADAIAEKDKHIQNLMERERQFNRDVSHELRTPLSVAVGAAEIMEKEGQKGAPFQRLASSLGNMQLLTEGILWLGREPDDSATCNVWKTCLHAIELNKHLLDEGNVEIEIAGSENIEMPVPEAVAQVIVGNLVRNAFGYTDQGTVSFSISNGRLSIDDTGIGIGEAASNTGFGIGLSLVERLSSHFDMQVSVDARSEGGTSAVVSW